METRYPSTDTLFNAAKSLLSAVITTSILLCAFNAQAREDIPSYSATYKAKYKGFKVKAKRELKHLENGHIQVSQSLSHFLMKIKESSESSVQSSDGRVLLSPQQYSYSRKGVGKNKNNAIEFNHQSKTLKETAGKKHYNVSKLPSGIQDKLSYQLQLRLDAMRYGDQFNTRHYPYIENGKVKQYSFRKVKDETLKTGLGELKTAVFERVRPEGSSRSTKIWLAKDWGYLIARIEQKENGNSKYALELESATIGKQAVNAFDSDSSSNSEEDAFGYSD